MDARPHFNPRLLIDDLSWGKNFSPTPSYYTQARVVYRWQVCVTLTFECPLSSCCLRAITLSDSQSTTIKGESTAHPTQQNKTHRHCLSPLISPQMLRQETILELHRRRQRNLSRWNIHVTSVQDYTSKPLMNKERPRTASRSVSTPFSEGSHSVLFCSSQRFHL